ncbi:sirohydrochlorin chelatase [Anabaena sp. FACHB-1237]|uniref:sirohydrochlorin chelatase n=1 Tax=Anabaena sp. FACHB-1237 TaxID=2692769 RepID=UPI001680BA16|nr:sirohydrochlorin chelatase [Anabaena sp. FACHB-1237]MBD2136454.1 sirohydrochlorin chelatase [Anabaena sp. FACHB-1237]
MAFYLLVSHGSNDPRPDIAMQKLAQWVANKLSPGKNLVGTATLELNSQPLHQQIQTFIHTLKTSHDQQNDQHLIIIPLFLLPGVHVTQDIPNEVNLAQRAVNGQITLELRPYLGSHPEIINLLLQMINHLNCQANILLAHGSRLAASQILVENIAANIGAFPAFLRREGSLELQVQKLVKCGYRQIAILPYFLFPGGITDAIAATVEKLKLQFPQVCFPLANTLAEQETFPGLIYQIIKEEKTLG